MRNVVVAVALGLSIFFSPYSVSFAKWQAQDVQGILFVKKKQLQMGQILPLQSSYSSTESGYLTLKNGKEKWILRFGKNSHFFLSLTEGQLGATWKSGGLSIQAIADNKIPFDFYFAQWKLRKTQGLLKVSGSKDEAWVSNDKGHVWIKKTESTEPAQEMPEAIKFKLQSDESIFAFENEKLTSEKKIKPWMNFNSSSMRSRAPASLKKSKKDPSMLCQAPQGQFQQCAWQCNGRSNKKEDRCETGYADTHCVRFMCTAGGQWKWPTLVPGGECPAAGTRVDQCQ